MKYNAERPGKVTFSRVEIYDEVQKILQDPRFASSKILKRFFLFIIDETLQGRANQLKEYTIAVSVLNRPKDFKPKDNAVVRVHAGNLRRALNNYYDAKGAADQLRISIPKGTYIPQFAKGIIEAISDENDDSFFTNTHAIVGVVPFTHLDDKLVNCFSHGLCTQLSSDLANIGCFSIIAYPVMCNLFETAHWKLTTLKRIQYLIAGNIQLMQDQVRVSVQLIEAKSNVQLWSGAYERRINNANIFTLQDEIANLVIARVMEFYNLKHHIVGFVA